MANNGEWKSTRLTKEGFDLEKVVNSKILDFLSEQFEDKVVEVTGISFFISDKSIDREENEKEFSDAATSVTITYPSIEDTENKKITLRVSEDSMTENVKKAIENFEESL